MGNLASDGTWSPWG